MAITNKGRLLYWLARELSQKYTRFFFAGILLGTIVIITLKLLFPFFSSSVFIPTKRIGIVGEFTPSNLPIEIQNKISIGLTSTRPDGSAGPGLATSWEATDSGKQYTFFIDPTKKWSSGKPITAWGINYNINTVEFTIADSHTLIARLNNPYSPFPVLLSKPIFAEKLVGLGPYKVVGLRLNGDKVAYLRLVPVDPAYTNALVYRFYKTEMQAMVAYKLGEIDILENMSTIDPALRTWKNTMIQKNPKLNRIVGVYFNMNDPLLKEKTFRQGLAHAIPDIDDQRAYSPISKTSWAYNDQVKHYTYDLDQAKKLLSSTKSGTQSAELTIYTFSQYLDIAQKIASNWDQAGVKTSIRVENSLPDEYQVLISALDIPADPDQYTLWHSTQTKTNITKYSNAKIDKLLEDGRQELNPDKRKSIYLDFQKRLVDDAPALFLYYPVTYTIERKR